MNAEQTNPQPPIPPKPQQHNTAPNDIQQRTDCPQQPNSGAPVPPPFPPTPGPKKKSHTGLIVTIVVVIVAFFLIVGAGGYYVYSKTKIADDEQTLFNTLEDNDNPEDYEAYLDKYPQGAHAEEVRNRLAKLNEMIQVWNGIAQNGTINDFRNFKNTYSDAKYARLCDIKIDSLDWVNAQKIGTAEALAAYLDVHPDGRYASEASIAQTEIKDNEISATDQDQVSRVCSEFFQGFQFQDETLICSNISSTMTTFLHQKNATKAEVVAAIKGMFNEHIQSCRFVLNRDMDIKRSTDKTDGSASYKATFTVDQHIERDNEGKTFGSYKCVATLNAQYLITSLTMTETSATR